MSDIAEYMRGGGPCIETNNKCKVMDTASGCACAQAADTIATLRATNERLRAALEPLACTCPAKHQKECSRSEVDCPFWNARAALAEEKPYDR